MGPPGAVVYALAIEAGPPEALYVRTPGGLHKSTDGGDTWALLPAGPLGVHVLATHPAAPSTVFAATASGLHRSIDGGATWTAVGAGLPSRIISLVAHPTNPSTLYAGLESVLSPQGGGAGHGGVHKSTDSGTTWFPLGVLSTFWLNAVTTSPAAPSMVLAGSSYVEPTGRFGGGVAWSTDGGVTWKGGPRGHVDSVAIDPSEPANLYAGHLTGLQRSTDEGRSWALANVGLEEANRVFGLAIDPSRPSTLYAATGRFATAVGGAGVHRSTDAGATWAAINAGLPREGAGELALSLADPATVYVALGDGSLWRSTRPAATVTVVVPSAARARGFGETFYTTDLTVANTGEEPATLQLKFLGNDVDGREGPERSYSIAARESRTFSDALMSVFGLASGFGAILLTFSRDSLRALAQTSTPGSGGTLGQSVPVLAATDLIRPESPRSILAIREDGAFRTNLVLVNLTGQPQELKVDLVAPDGSVLASKGYGLAPLGMTQVTRVVRDLGVSADVNGARLVLSSLHRGSYWRFAAYASVIDNVTNDPRTLLPQ